jgi:hypothetical protein
MEQGASYIFFVETKITWKENYGNIAGIIHLSFVAV